VFKISVSDALQQRPDEAKRVIEAELRQMLDKGVWTPVHVHQLDDKARRTIIRSSMFLKDKFLASGDYEKLKARLVAGGDQQDKTLYDDLSSPTAATSSVLIVAALAASEGRDVCATDIGGAFLNASMADTGVIVHMRLRKELASILCEMDGTYRDYVEPSGSVVVRLRRALYGCVEAAKLWHDTLIDVLKAMGFRRNARDGCVLNRSQGGKPQVTIALHVDDLLITSTDRGQITEVIDSLKQRFGEVKTAWGPRLSYVGMTLDFTTAGEVAVTMANCTADLLHGLTLRAKPTPAATELFEIRPEAQASTESVRKEFHTRVAKLLYLSKRTRPECLTVAAFLSTRVQACDADDCAKLRRVLEYVQATAERGIKLRVSDPPIVRAYIDASYGVHTGSGRSHTGCAVTIGTGPVFVKSAKQRIVTKSSTEAELVGLSDTATQAIHINEFLREQGIATGPAVLGQDNMSTIALTRRGGPGSERSRHIAIRYFWLKERMDDGDVTVEHVPTEDMVANVLTKPVQGAQFTREREMLTGWTDPSVDGRGVLGEPLEGVAVLARERAQAGLRRTTTHSMSGREVRTEPVAIE
jgi:hypothetical protein